MTDETMTEWLCPKDATPMEPMGRRGRGGAYRCPTCRGVFLDVETMRRGRKGQVPKWAPFVPFVMSVFMSVAMTMLVRRLRRRTKVEAPSQPPE